MSKPNTNFCQILYDLHSDEEYKSASHTTVKEFIVNEKLVIVNKPEFVPLTIPQHEFVKCPPPHTLEALSGNYRPSGFGN